ncbi:hypothetical protein FGO68_gene1178 [Halteria grandinella]|uniref:Uncharacterized protein n=1 Tax=Halteria grandinella TaxID=5974 RepID=A0A8J8NR39_HALGN|nr:hypothetical protein FGO68_gene1178 [Halteria grandinella]
MDGQDYFSKLARRNGQEGNNSLLPPRQALEDQTRQSIKIAEAEIDELKQSLRYIEIQLARSKEENENLNAKIHEQHQEMERGGETLAKQVRFCQQQTRTIEDLQKKLDGYTNNQKETMEKNRFKAGTYMTEINQREEELGRIRAQLMNNQDEMKLLTVTREQFRQQKEALAEKLKDRDGEIDKLNRRLIEMNRLVDSMCVAQRSVANNGDGTPAEQAAALDKARDDIERADRIAKSTTKSSFMALGDKQPKLLSEDVQAKQYGTGGPKTLSNIDGGSSKGGDDAYLRDESLPPEIFNIIQAYREKIMKLTKGSQSAALVFDDFFGEMHSILKDSHMREIARIRNEHSVEIIKLRKNLDSRLRSASSAYASTKGSSPGMRSKENFQAFKGNEHFVENELERQRRALIEENELLKKRLRAIETIVNSGNQERAKFMEGASWIARKAHVETERHIQKLQGLMGEFQRKFRDTCLIDEQIAELNGREVIKVNRWLAEAVEREIHEVGERYESMFENVNFHLSEANKQFAQQRANQMTFK